MINKSQLIDLDSLVYPLFVKNGSNLKNSVRITKLNNRDDIKFSVNKPRFSICIPTFNRAKFLKEAIQSALSQDSNNFEIVKVYYGSTDNTD